MNKNIFVSIITLLFSISLSAQINWKKYIIPGSAMIVSGMLDGSIESLSFHYNNGVKPHFFKINDQFWNPAISWTNKYKNGNPNLGQKFIGSTNVFAFTTDGYHMLRTTNRAIDGSTIAYYLNTDYCAPTINKKKKFKNMAVDFVILTVIRSIGFNLTYNLLFNPNVHYKI